MITFINIVSKVAFALNEVDDKSKLTFLQSHFSAMCSKATSLSILMQIIFEHRDVFNVFLHFN